MRKSFSQPRPKGNPQVQMRLGCCSVPVLPKADFVLDFVFSPPITSKNVTK